MKNLPVSMKLILSFAMVIVLAVIVGIVGIVGMNSINNADDEMYEYNLKAVSAMGEIREILQRQRVAMRHYPLYADDHASLSAAKNSMEEWERAIEAYFAEYEATITDESAESAYYNAKGLYKGTFATMKKEIYEQSLISYQAGHDRLFDPSVVATTDEIAEGFTIAMANNNTWAKEQVDANTSLFSTMTFIEIAVLAVAVIFAMFLAFYISSLIAKPLGVLTVFMKKAGGVGDISMTAAEAEELRRFGEARDEIGQCISSTSSFLKHITTVSHELEVISGGDLTGELVLLSDKDTIGLSLQKTVNNLNTMFSEIHSSTAQVSAGSKQIADGAQALAQGSTQQAAAVEQLSSSITEIADMTKTNADMADKAAHLASTIKENAEKGSRQMDEMMGAVKEINQASHSINKVIKVIDDIAFQTNILALNAAVEAARAGQHGKGFAVVAEEVRNLAAKSAEAAKDTGGLIANSIEKAELGARIADDTAASLSEIVSGINESNQLVADIAKSSDEQAQGIAQINKGIDQVAQVIQQNSATAEESAAASEEMSGQANMLEDLIAQFKIRNDGSHRTLGAGSSRNTSAPKRLSMPEKRTSYAPPAGGDDFGKY